MTIQEIQSIVAAEWRVTLCDLLSRRRDRAVVTPRHVGMWLARHTTLASLPEIGRAFGGRDHSTVMHAIGSINARMAEEPALRATVRRLMGYNGNAGQDGPDRRLKEQSDGEDRQVPAVDSSAPDARRPGDDTPTVGQGASRGRRAGSRPSERRAAA